MPATTATREVAMSVRGLLLGIERHRLLVAGRLGIGLYELVALGHLYADGPLSPGAIAGRLHVTSASVTGVIDRLERVGLVERSPHPTDRRRVLVTITPAGTAAVDPAFASFADAIEDAARDFDDAGRERLRCFFDDATRGMRDRDDRHAV